MQQGIWKDTITLIVIPYQKIQNNSLQTGKIVNKHKLLLISNVII